MPLCEATVKSGFCICCSRREKSLYNISTWWYFRYLFRRPTDGARHFLLMLLHSRCVSIKILVSCVERSSLFPALATDEIHNTSHFLSAFQKHWWGVLMQNVQDVRFRTWDLMASFLTAKWKQWLFSHHIWQFMLKDKICFVLHISHASWWKDATSEIIL